MRDIEQREVKTDPKSFSLSSWRTALPLVLLGKDCGWNSCERDIGNLFRTWMADVTISYACLALMDKDQPAVMSLIVSTCRCY
jgi:hypothetical protein